MIDSRLTENRLNPQKVYSQQYVDELKAKYSWHTGTPTEEGWYLVAYQHKNKITYRAVRFFLEKGLDMEFLDSEGGIYYPDIWKAVAWQKIEPYEGGKMSDVLIKNIQIPRDNKRLALFIDKDGDVSVFDGNEFNRITDAIEVPTHGRLGDLDALSETIDCSAFWDSSDLSLIRDIVNYAPTIIEASTEGEATT